jgi:glycosyltransferase involved in cell wall biosynthesis
MLDSAADLRPRHKVTVVMPAFNEAATVGGVVKEVLRHVDEVVVVDDCSSDSTSIEAANAGATVVRHDVNQGYDGALNAGFIKASESGAAVIVTFDADGEHRAEDLPAVVELILSGRNDLVLTARPELMHFSERIFALYTRLRFGISDPLCGFKAYHRNVYDRFGAFDTLKSIGTELALRAIKAGFRPAIYPIPRGHRADTSRFYAALLRANLRIFTAMLRVAAAIR